MKGKTGDVAVRPADFFPSIMPANFTPNRASRVLDNCQLVALSDGGNQADIARHADLMNAEYGPSARVDLFLDEGRIEIVSIRLDIDENRRRAAVSNTVCSGDKGM